MRPLLLTLAAVIVAGAVAFSRPGADAPLRIAREKSNPWTSLDINNDPQSFQFAIVSDRTGSRRAKVFSRAVERLNLLQPEFVVSVGDLIEGGKKTRKQLAAEWEEFDGYVKRLQMPFFYVPGNHDVGNAESQAVWKERYGRKWYHFVYRGVLFLCLDSDDPPGSGVGKLDKEQVEYAKKALTDNADVRWTIVLIHKPVWTAPDGAKRGWLDVESALATRPYTVFCGHVHRYKKYVRQGRNYYQLATTGGVSKMRGVEFGEFDHIAWVTMKKDGPVMANVLLDSVLGDDLSVPDSKEKGRQIVKRKTFGVRGVVYFDGAPLVGASVVLSAEEDKTTWSAEGFTEGDGSFRPTTYTNFDGIPIGKYAVTVVQRRPLVLANGKAGPNQLPVKYADAKSSGIVVEIKEGDAEFRIELEKAR